MELPVQITTRRASVSEAARELIKKKAGDLDSFYDRITSCRVVVEAPHRRHHKGILYNVRVDMTVPGAELVIKREPNEDLYVAIRDAFDAATRRLEEHARRQRGKVKLHEATPRGRVTRLFPADGYGFLETLEGREIYFHRKAVLNGGFDRLEIGTEVRFAEERGEEGPQASTVTPVGRGG